MTELKEKPDDLTEYQWNVYQDRRDEQFTRTKYHNGRWTGSPWDIYSPQLRRACNILVQKGYFTIDEAMRYYIATEEELEK